MVDAMIEYEPDISHNLSPVLTESDDTPIIK